MPFSSGLSFLPYPSKNPLFMRVSSLVFAGIFQNILKNCQKWGQKWAKVRLYFLKHNLAHFSLFFIVRYF